MKRSLRCTDKLTTPFLHVAIAGAVCITLATLVVGCPTTTPVDPGEPGNGGDDAANARDCVGCHVDEALLKVVAKTEAPPAEDTGEG